MTAKDDAHSPRKPAHIYTRSDGEPLGGTGERRRTKVVKRPMALDGVQKISIAITSSCEA